MDSVDNSLSDTPKGQSILKWLLDRGISNQVIREAGITWNGTNIVIPIKDAQGIVLFNKYRRDPERSIGPKYTYQTGSKAVLYGIEDLSISNKVIICEGEFDSLALRTRGYFAYSSTGGAGTFPEDWAKLFSGKDVYVVFDNDEAGLKGSIKICNLIPHAKLVRLPPFVGDHGDVTDYFRIRNVEDFSRLLKFSIVPLIERSTPKPPTARRSKIDGTKLENAKGFPIEDLLAIKKHTRGNSLCPFHKESTPSFKIYHKSNRWYCFGCQRGGDSIDFVKLKYGLSMNEAIEYILKLTS